MKKRISGNDVAREAGVSQSTVSLVLNGREDAGIPEATRQRVLEVAHRLRYRRNATARALITGKTNRIGVVADHPDQFLSSRGTYYGTLLAGMLQGVRIHSHNLLFHSSDYPDWQTLTEDILSGGTDGALLIGRPYNDPLVEVLQEAEFPHVHVSSHPRTGGYYAIDCDNEMGGYLAARHLLSLGHRTLLFAGTTEAASWSEERWAGVQRAIKEAASSGQAIDAIEVAKTAIQGESIIDSLLRECRERRPEPMGVLINDEFNGLYFAQAAIQQGWRIPEEIALVGYNATDYTLSGIPAVTAIYQPLQEIGAAAVDLLIRLIRGESVAPGVTRFPVQLAVRQTCGARSMSTHDIIS